MDKIEVGDYVLAVNERDSDIINGKIYKVLGFDGWCLELRDEDGDLRSRPVDAYLPLSKEEFVRVQDLKDELYKLSKNNENQEFILGEHVKRIQYLEREIDSLKRKLKTVHEVTTLIGGYE